MSSKKAQPWRPLSLDEVALLTRLLSSGVVDAERLISQVEGCLARVEHGVDYECLQLRPSPLTTSAEVTETTVLWATYPDVDGTRVRLTVHTDGRGYLDELSAERDDYARIQLKPCAADLDRIRVAPGLPWRETTVRERRLLHAMLAPSFDGVVSLREQAATCLTRELVDDTGLEFHFERASGLAEIHPNMTRIITEGRYADIDGMEVKVELFTHEGRLNFLVYYRWDFEPVRRRPVESLDELEVWYT